MSKIDVPRIIAHRGASGHAPENTAAAIRKAHELGATWVEFDCMLSKDGRVFLNHDETLERTAGVDHRACDLELADLVHLDVGSWFSADYAGETIPTFRDTMILLSELGMGANVEIKPCKGFEAATGAAVAKEIDSHWPADIPPPVVSSFSRDSLVAAIPLLGSEIEVAQLWGRVPAEWRQELAELGATAVHCNAFRLEKEIAGQIAASGTPLRCYTVNEVALADKLFGWGVNCIITDYPDMFL